MEELKAVLENLRRKYEEQTVQNAKLQQQLVERANELAKLLEPTSQAESALKRYYQERIFQLEKAQMEKVQIHWSDLAQFCPILSRMLHYVSFHILPKKKKHWKSALKSYKQHLLASSPTTKFVVHVLRMLC